MGKHTYLFVPIVVLILATLIALSLGSQYVPFWHALSGALDQQQQIILSLRLPRVLNAITVGALLSIAGLMIQNLLKNPLADPYILGISGASASVQLAIIASGIILPFWLFMLSGFVAAILSLLLVIFLSSKKSLHTHHLLLSGVVIAFAYGAFISLMLTLSPASSTKPMLFWLMGDLSYSSFSLLPVLLLFSGLLCALIYHKELDLLARGEFFALKCGVNVKRINLILLTGTTVFTALAVSMAGTIGFIGLVIPHICRLIVGNIHLKLIPLSAIIGAIVLLIADTFSRTVVAPIQLPVGIFTALLGVPTFLYLMRKS